MMARRINETGEPQDGEAESATHAARMAGQPFYYAGLLLIGLVTLFLNLKAGDLIRYQDEFDYEQIARSILHRHEVGDYTGQLVMGRPPGYPAAIALVYSLAERPLAAKLENTLFLLLAVVALVMLTRRIEPLAGALVPYLVLAYPLLIYAATVLYPQIASCLLITIIVMLVTREQFTVRDGVLAGLLYGGLILAVPSFILLLPLIAATTVIARANGRWRIRWAAVKPAIVLGCFAAILVVPWTARNYLEFHVFVPISTNSGTNLFIGNSPVTTANSGRTTDVIPLCPAMHDNMTEYDIDAAMHRCAVDWISQHPGAAATLYVGKLINYFNYRNDIATPSEGAQWREWLVFATYYPMLLITLLRLAAARRYPLTRAETLIYLLYFFNAFVSAIFFTRLRFRIPFDFLLIAVNAAFLARWWTARRNALAQPGQSGQRVGA
jgi:hypothetical protein